MVTQVGGQILATKFGFVPDCWTVPILDYVFVEWAYDVLW